MISPLGNSVESLWQAITAGRSGVAELEGIDSAGIPTTYAAAARDFTGSIDNFGELEKQQSKQIRKGLKIMCRESQMGVASAQLALSDAGLKVGQMDPERSGCLFGSDYMVTLPEDFTAGIKQCLDEQGKFHFDRWAKEGLPRVTPLWLLMYLPNMPASHVAIYNDLRGPNNSITEREASGNLAVGEAFFTISRGSADVLVAGATGTRIHPMKFAHALLQEEIANGKFPPERACRPFDKDRSGAVLGEGSAAMVLEEFSHAEKRGATIHGEVIGRSSSAVADVESRPDVTAALINAMRGTLRDAKLKPEEIGHIHAHGISTREGDRSEAAAIAAVFGEAKCPVVAAKSYFGNLGAGSGVTELIASIRALEEGHLFPILNYETPDPEAPILAATADMPAGAAAMNLSVTPQGQASCVIVRRV